MRLLGERKPDARLGGARATRARAPTSNPLRAQICGAQAWVVCCGWGRKQARRPLAGSPRLTRGASALLDWIRCWYRLEQAAVGSRPLRRDSPPRGRRALLRWRASASPRSRSHPSSRRRIADLRSATYECRAVPVSHDCSASNALVSASQGRRSHCVVGSVRSTLPTARDHDWSVAINRRCRAGGWSADPCAFPDDPNVARPRLEPIHGCGELARWRLGRPALANASNVAAALQILEPSKRLVAAHACRTGGHRRGERARQLGQRRTEAIRAPLGPALPPALLRRRGRFSRGGNGFQ